MGKQFKPALLADAEERYRINLGGTRAVLETVADYVHEQGLSARRVELKEIFAPSTLDV